MPEGERLARTSGLLWAVLGCGLLLGPAAVAGWTAIVRAGSFESLRHLLLRASSYRSFFPVPPAAVLGIWAALLLSLMAASIVVSARKRGEATAVDVARPGLLAGGGLLLALALLRGFLLGMLVPPLQVPDEDWHFDYVQYIGEARALPPGADLSCGWGSPELEALSRAFLEPVRHRSETPLPPPAVYQPPDPRQPASRWTNGCSPLRHYGALFYLTAAAGYLARGPASLVARLHGARAVSALWGALGVLAAYVAGTVFFGNKRDGMLLGLAVLLQPMIGFLSAGVSNDSAHFALAGLAFAALAAVRAGRRKGGLVVLAVVLALGVHTKPTFTLSLPAFFLCAALALWPLRPRTVLLAALAMAPAVLAFFAGASSGASALGFLHSRSSMSLADYLRARVLSFGFMKWMWFETYWGSWGWVDVYLTDAGYIALFAISFFALAGLVVGWRSLCREHRCFLVAAAVGSAIQMAALHWIEYRYLQSTGENFIQGRYLLGLYPLHAAALVIGLRELGRRLQVRFDGAWALVTVLAATHAALVVEALRRYYA